MWDANSGSVGRQQAQGGRCRLCVGTSLSPAESLRGCGPGGWSSARAWLEQASPV